jgi:CRP-like cAMP-binding protein
VSEQFEQDFPVLAARLGKRHLPALAAVATFVELPAGTRLTADQAPVDTLWLIAEGVCTVTVESGGRTIRLGRLGKGQWIGEVSLLTGDQASSTVTTETAARLLALKHADFKRLQEENLAAASALVRVLIDVLAQRLRASGEMLQKTPGADLELRGSDVVREGTPEKKSWFKKVLERISGTRDETPEDAGDDAGEATAEAP